MIRMRIECVRKLQTTHLIMIIIIRYYYTLNVVCNDIMYFRIKCFLAGADFVCMHACVQ